MRKLLVVTVILCLSWACSDHSSKKSNLGDDPSSKNAERTLSKAERDVLSSLCANRDKFYGEDVVYNVREVSCNKTIKSSETTQIEGDDLDRADWEKFCSIDFAKPTSNKLVEGEHSIFIFVEKDLVQVTYAKNDIIKMTYKLHSKDNSLVSLFVSRPCAEAGKNSDIIYTDKKKENIEVINSLPSRSLDIYTAEGVVGATCWANPIDKIGGRDVCRSVEEKFYPGIIMALAKKSMVKDCQHANALDLGKCYEKCSTATYCIYGDNR
jgi:hypothetical protein